MVIMTETVGPSSPREDPRITNEAVEAAAHSLYQSDAQGQWEHGELELLLAYRAAARGALEAALPLLAPQPVDREAAAKALHESDAQRHVWASRFCSGACQRRYHQSADAVLALMGE